jgi:hypothetical protein
MEVPQGNSLCSYLKQPKISCFSSSFLIQNLENRRMKQLLPGEVGTSGRGEDVGKW